MSGYMARSQRGDWQTPTDLVLKVREALGGRIDLDPCASTDPRDHVARANINPGPFLELDNSMRTFHADSPAAVLGDGLAQEWHGSVFVNPPFEALSVWAAKCAIEAERGAEVILLLPARTDTRYWHAYVSSADAICFLRGRLRFVGAAGPCPFPTALVYWGDRPLRFAKVFGPLGMVVEP